MVKKLKDKKIELFKVEYIRDEDGYETKSFINLTPIPIWAYFRQLSGKEYYAAAAIQSYNFV